MASVINFPRTVAQVVNAFVVSPRSKWIVSTADGIRMVRYLVPDCQHTDRELAEMLAACAVRQGRTVAFDGDHDAGRVTALAG